MTHPFTEHWVGLDHAPGTSPLSQTKSAMCMRRLSAERSLKRSLSKRAIKAVVDKLAKLPPRIRRVGGAQ